MFCLCLSSKQIKHDNALQSYLDRLEAYDVKVQNQYIIDATTHVVSNKRNVPKGLQALVNAKYIVKDTYVDAVVDALTPAATDSSGLSPLEVDYDACWPNAAEFLPEPGKEPIPRETSLFAPDPERLRVFDGYSFVFADSTQYEQLNPPLTNGGAKTFMFEIKLGTTVISDMIAFVKNIAGETGGGELRDGGQGKGVVVVRFRGKAGTEEWALDFIRGMDLALGQRSVEQNEFLDAILSNNASTLRRPLLDEEADSNSVPSSNTGRSSPVMSSLALLTSVAFRAHAVQVMPSQSTPPQPGSNAQDSSANSQPRSDHPTVGASQTAPRHRIRRTLAQSRFKGYDDFDMTQIAAKKHSESPEPPGESDFDPPPQSQVDDMDVESQTLFVTDSLDATTQGQANRKRTREQEDIHHNHESMVDSLLPGAARMKKRRLEADKTGSVGESQTPQPTAPSSSTATRAKSKPAMDVRSAARSHAEAIDAKDANAQEDVLDYDVDEIAGLRDLAIIEEMEVPTRRMTSATRRQGDDRGRWDDQWNGRKNFKRFRKQGMANNAALANRAQRILIRLEEAKRKDYGTSETTFFHREEDSSRRRASRPASRAHSQTHTPHSGSGDNDAAIVVEDVDGEPDRDLPQEVAGVPRDTMLAKAVQAQVQHDARGAVKGTASNKRAASQSQASLPATKRRVTAAAGRKSAASTRADDSDEDDLAFVPSRLRNRAR